MKRLGAWLALLAVAATPIYSPKDTEQRASLKKAAPVQVQPQTATAQSLSVKPPVLYYLPLTWTNLPNSCGSTWRIDYGQDWRSYTNHIVAPNTNSTMTVNVSNLLANTTYFFDFSVSDCSPTSAPWAFPPPNPPLTNFQWVGASNWAGQVLINPPSRFYRAKAGWLQSAPSLTGGWSNLFQIKGVTNFSNPTNWLLTVRSNNQVRYLLFKQ